MNAVLTMSKISKLHSLIEDKLILESEDNNITRYSLESTHLPVSLLKNVQENNIIGEYEKLHGNDDLNKMPTKINYESIVFVS